jgi:hypothetical protein
VTDKGAAIEQELDIATAGRILAIVLRSGVGLSLDGCHGLLVGLHQSLAGGKLLIGRPENSLPWPEGECFEIGIGLMENLPHAERHLVAAGIGAASIRQAPHASLATGVDASINA